MNTVYEWCPDCEQDVPLRAVVQPQMCPECGTWIVPCSICRALVCRVCWHEQRAKSLNRDRREKMTNWLNKHRQEEKENEQEN